MAVHELKLAVLGSDGKPGKPLAFKTSGDAPDIGDRLALNGAWHLVVDIDRVQDSKTPTVSTWIYLRKLDALPAAPRPTRGLLTSERVFVLDVDDKERRAWLRVVAPVLPPLPPTMPPPTAGAPSSPSLSLEVSVELPPETTAPAERPQLPSLPLTMPPGPLAFALPQKAPPRARRRLHLPHSVIRLMLAGFSLLILAALAFAATLALSAYR